MKPIKNYGTMEDTCWLQFAKEHNGKYILGQYGDADGVELIYKNHRIVFDVYTKYVAAGRGTYQRAYTRVRTEFLSPDGLRFRLTQQGIFESIGKLFGAQDIIIGDEIFDKKFMINGNDEYKIQCIFSNTIIKKLVLSQEDIQLEIDTEGIFNEIVAEGNSLLYYVSTEKIKDLTQLNTLKELFTALIDQLIKINATTYSRDRS